MATPSIALLREVSDTLAAVPFSSAATIAPAVCVRGPGVWMARNGVVMLPESATPPVPPARLMVDATSVPCTVSVPAGL